MDQFETALRQAMNETSGGSGGDFIDELSTVVVDTIKDALAPLRQRISDLEGRMKAMEQRV